MPKNTNKTKKIETHFNLTANSIIENYYTISIKFVFFNLSPKSNANNEA